MRNIQYARRDAYNWKYRDSRYDPNRETRGTVANGLIGKVCQKGKTPEGGKWNNVGADAWQREKVAQKTRSA